MNWLNDSWKGEFFTVLLVFLLESAGIQAILGILAVLPAKTIISIPAEFWWIPEWPQESPEWNCLRN